MNHLKKKLFPAMAACLALSCAAPRNTVTVPGDTTRVYPHVEILPVEFDGVKAGLVRGIVGAPEEMLDTAVRNAGSFGAAEVRELRSALQSETRNTGFGRGEATQPLEVRVRVLTYVVRVGEIWPAAEYLVEAEYSVHGGAAAAVSMYYRAWFYWSMQSLRKDVLESLAIKIIHDIARNLDGGTRAKLHARGHAMFFDDARAAREEFLGE